MTSQKKSRKKFTNSLEKIFYAIHFLKQFNVSTQKQAHIKKLILESFHQLQNDKNIKNQFKLITKSRLIKEMNQIGPLRVGQRYYFMRNSKKYLKTIYGSTNSCA